MPTIGTLIYTLLKGRLVGSDEEGNRYYEERGRTRGWLRKRRWVVYKGADEATRVPPDWHRWLHHTAKEPPTETPLPHQPWERPHQPNLTGTPQTYRPRGSEYRGGKRARATGDYEAWTPE